MGSWGHFSENFVKKSILTINFGNGSDKVEKRFSFHAATVDEIYSHIKRLDPKTSTVKDDISINHLVGCNDISLRQKYDQ